MKCSHCDNELFPKEASIPERIICYKAGVEDPNIPGNRIVIESHCPVHGCVFSPGGGICGTVLLKGGPWDGRQPIWSPHPSTQKVLVGGEEHLYQHQEGTAEPMVFDYIGVGRGQ